MTDVSGQVEQLAKFTGDAETFLRFFKAAETWVHLGVVVTLACGYSGAQGFKNCEKWLKGVSATQNILRMIKAFDLCVKMRHEGKQERKEGDWIHHTLTYLSPLTLGLVATTSMVSFLESWQVFRLSTKLSQSLVTFGKYGGGLWGNVLAAFGGFYAARDFYKQAMTALPVDSQKEKDIQGDKNFLGGTKYGLDLVASGLELVPGADSIPGLSSIVFTIKGVSRHVAIFQSFVGSYKICSPSLHSMFKVALWVD